MKFVFFLMATMFSGKVWAQAACVNMQLQVNQTSFDLVSSQTVNPTLVVKANTNPGGCSFFLTFGYGLGSSYTNRALRMGADAWPFQISKDSAGTQIIKRIPDIASTNDVLTGTLAAGSNDRQVSVTYWAKLDMSNPWMTAGSYEDSFVVSLYRGDPFGSNSFVSSNSVRFFYRAGNRVDISLVPTGAAFALTDTTETLNFGSLSTGATKTCDAVVKYNSGYILKASSANNGRMKHDTMSEYIDYTATFNGSTFNLSTSSGNPVQIIRQLGQSPASGVRVPIGVTIGSVAGKRGGSYQDTITLTVQSAE